MSTFNLYIFVVFLVLSSNADKNEISDFRKCANNDCTEIISIAKTMIMYPSPGKGILSFRPNMDAKVFSKEAGTNLALWGVEIEGRRGYVPKQYIRENKILFRERLSFLVPTEAEYVAAEPLIPSSTEIPLTIQPASVLEPYEVIDGTTVYSQNTGYSTPAPQPIVDSSANENVPEDSPAENEISVDSANKSFEADDVAIDISVNVEKASPATKEISTESPNVIDDEKGNYTENIINDIVGDLSEASILRESNTSITNGTQHDIYSFDDVIKDINNLLIKSDGSTDNINDNEHTEITRNSISDGEQGTNQPETDTKLNDSGQPNTISSGENPSLNSDQIISEGLSKTQDILPPITSNTDLPLKADHFAHVTHETDYLRPPSTFTPITEDSTTFPPVTQTGYESPLHPLPTPTPIIVDDSTIPSDQFPHGTLDASIEKPSEQREDIVPLNSTEPNYIASDTITIASLPEDDPHSGHNIPFVVPESVKVLDESDLQILKVDEKIDGVLDLDEPLMENSEEYNSIKDLQDENILTALVGDITVLPEIQEAVTEPVYDQISTTQYPEVDSTSSQQTIDSFGKEISEQSDQIGEEIGLPGAHDTVTAAPEILQPDGLINDSAEESEGGIFSSLYDSIFGSTDETPQSNSGNAGGDTRYVANIEDVLLSQNFEDSEKSCSSNFESLHCHASESTFPSVSELSAAFNISDFYNLILVLTVTGGTTVLFFWGYILIDKSRKEGPLIAKINQLEKSLLVSVKENKLLQQKCDTVTNMSHLNSVPNEVVADLQAELDNVRSERTQLQEQIQTLEKELENSTEVGLELNKMLSDMLSSQSGSDTLVANIEQMQRQLIEQQEIITNYNDNLNEKTTENHELQLDLDINKKKVLDLQAELDKMVINILKVEEERDENQTRYEEKVKAIKEELASNHAKFSVEIQRMSADISKLTTNYTEALRNFELKSKEYDLLKDGMNEVTALKDNTETLKSLIDASTIKAELAQLKQENLNLGEHLRGEEQKKYAFEKQAELAIQEAKLLKIRFEEADKDKLGAQTKLEVLSNYFKDKEAQLQKDLNKYEALWNEKQGEASSTVERIKYMQEELVNYKSQTETLKQEIVSQEVELKSQISVLEKKVHENWVSARHTERMLDDSKQEAAQLRNRLTLSERNHGDDKNIPNLNGTDPSLLPHMPPPLPFPLSPLPPPNHLDTTSSPPLLFGGLHDMTAPPPMMMHPPLGSGGGPPFMPPPPGGMPFMPSMPPPHPLAFMPPPLSAEDIAHHHRHRGPGGSGGGLSDGEELGPGSDRDGGPDGAGTVNDVNGQMYPPGDHRPPPLGRISSPTLNVNRRGGQYSQDGDYYDDEDDRSLYSPYMQDRHPGPHRHSPVNYPGMDPYVGGRMGGHMPPNMMPPSMMPPPMGSHMPPPPMGSHMPLPFNHHRGGPDFGDRDDYMGRPSHGRRYNGDSTRSSGSANSTESLDKSNSRHHTKV